MAESVLALRNLRAETVISAADIRRSDTAVAGGVTDPAAAIGMETRVNIYKGRPVMTHELAPPALVERNQVITLNYDHAGLAIATEGRALDRGSVGERIRVMNLSSRTTVFGRITADGAVAVTP